MDSVTKRDWVPIFLLKKNKIKGSKIESSKQSTWALTRQVANFWFCAV